MKGVIGTPDAPIPILTGPTAVGKTDLSIALGRELGAEIISADSRQIYRDLTIGTAKPTPEALQQLPHHFIDELELGERYSAGRFQEDAYERIASIIGRRKYPLVVGGSTLYLHALKVRLADIPFVPQSVRRTVEDRLAREGAEALYRELIQVDPSAARTMDATKTQRLIRALEVYEATGRPLSSYHDDQPDPPYSFETFVLSRDRQQLYDRINKRVDNMLTAGLLDEVRSILSSGFDPALNPLQTIGYQEPIRYLRGEFGFDEMVRLIKRNSRRYAKRQITWFRRDDYNVWLDATKAPNQLIKAVRG